MSSDAVPTDSVLRRHYEASNGKSGSGQRPATSKGGIFGWLKRIFN